MKPFDIRTVTSSMYSAVHDDRTSNSMPSFPTNGMDINSNTVNGYRINSNSIFDIQSVFRTLQGEIVNVAVQRNAVSSGERNGKVVRKKRGNTNSKEDETSQYVPSVIPSNPLTQPTKEETTPSPHSEGVYRHYTSCSTSPRGLTTLFTLFINSFHYCRFSSCIPFLIFSHIEL